MRTYRDYCRPAQPIERTSDRAKPGEIIFTGRGFVRAPECAVAMRKVAR